MPSRPSAARRRFHTARVIARRVKVARATAHYDLADITPGRLDDQQYYMRQGTSPASPARAVIGTRNRTRPMNERSVDVSSRASEPAR
jgi:hypothetical protein